MRRENQIILFGQNTLVFVTALLSSRHTFSSNIELNLGHSDLFLLLFLVAYIVAGGPISTYFDFDFNSMI